MLQASECTSIYYSEDQKRGQVYTSLTALKSLGDAEESEEVSIRVGSAPIMLFKYLQIMIDYIWIIVILYYIWISLTLPCLDSGIYNSIESIYLTFVTIFVISVCAIMFR